MWRNMIYNDINSALPDLAIAVLERGSTFNSRNGATHDLSFSGITLTMPDRREITLPGRKHNLAAQIAETMWVLSGRDDVEFLGLYLPRAADFSDDGKVWRGGYGKRLRRWPRRNGSGDVIDQLAHVIRLLKEDPNSRRAVISIYDPEVDCADGKDIPCNDFLTLAVRNGTLDVGVTIRSNDLMWGWSGINAFEWSTLQEIVAGVLGLEIGALHFSITSLHLYEQHWEKARKLRTEVALPAKNSPRFRLSPGFRTVDALDHLFDEWFAIELGIRTGDPEADLRVGQFPEPMLQSWLRVLQWWWSADETYLAPLTGTRLAVSAQVAVQPKREQPTTPLDREFVEYVTKLHSEKHAAYGDSWKRRGEMLGIMANIARKIDRLGSNSTTADESAADTAIDLLVYLAKYRWWLTEQAEAPSPGAGTSWSVPYSEGSGAANNLIRRYAGTIDGHDTEYLEEWLTDRFAALEHEFMNSNVSRYKIVDEMLPGAFALAERLWSQQ